MNEPKPRRMARLRGRLESLPLPALALIGITIVAVTTTGGYYAYQTYDYIEHDNEFCFSCHLMQEPFELFAQSEHRGLGCKACHQPNMLQRSEMGLTAIVVDPDSVGAHSAVPNDLCADCHINGDPEKWTLVAQSAGHRVHLESEDSSLVGLQCVECHASSLHEFTATDQTCAQSGCHTDSDVQLGAMSDLTIHCAACHGFNTPSDDLDAAMGALGPNQDTCLSCHAMRLLVELPNPDPHEGSCASCHNPHEQQTPAEAAQSCASSDCHSEPLEVSAFHVGLEEAVLGDCLYCHQAHDFHVDGANCLACHQEIMRDESGAVRPSTAVRPTAGQGPSAALSQPTVVRPAALSQSAAVRSAALSPANAIHSWNGPLPQTLDFRHSDHPELECADCHESAVSHGMVTVTTISDCRSCHHAGESAPAGGPDVDCASCHRDSASTGDPYAVTQTLTWSTGSSARRPLPFDHAPHDELDCASCHTEGLALSAALVDCASCHVEHHEPSTDCQSCHVEAPEGSHRIETAHVTCSGAGCHTDVPFDVIPRTRTACLVCHQDLVDHRPDGDCAECHALSGE